MMDQKISKEDEKKMNDVLKAGGGAVDEEKTRNYYATKKRNKKIRYFVLGLASIIIPIFKELHIHLLSDWSTGKTVSANIITLIFFAGGLFLIHKATRN